MNIETTTDDNIVAIATANGIGAISIIRVSGKDSLAIATKLTKKENFTPRVATLSKIYKTDGNIIDEGLIIYFKSPYSFTGEDIVEFQVHGGIAISSIILDEILSLGVRLAEAGEFSKRAFINQKLDYTKIEAISKMIEAKSTKAIDILAKQLRGDLKVFVDDIKEDLLFMLAYTEVSIDYAEDDIPDDIMEQISSKITKIESKLNQAIEVSKQREGLIDGFKVSIIGKPNVGKSSLLNRLLNYDRAIVSDIAGTTRDTIEESVKIGGHLIKIVDTAGIRETDDTIEKIGIQRSKDAIEQSDIIIAIFDNSREFDSKDQDILNLLDTPKDVIVVKNKIDLESKLISDIDFDIDISSKSDISKLIRYIENILDKSGSEDSLTLISKRQINSVVDTSKEISNAKRFLETLELEFFAFHITNALKYISQITSPYDNEQMLDVMFGEFCLGK